MFCYINLSEQFNSKLILDYYTYISPFNRKNYSVQLNNYYYFCCYLWLLKEIGSYTFFKINIIVNRKKYVSLVKAPKCHKKGKYLFWLKSYKILVFFLNFIISEVLIYKKVVEIFTYIKIFYNNLSSNLMFQRKIIFTQECKLNILQNSSIVFFWNLCSLDDCE